MMGNPFDLPDHPWYLEALGVVPVKARIYKIEDDGYLDEEPTLWQLDGYAVVGGHFAVTGTVWNFPTWEAALAELPAFERAVREACEL
jgi:hypothetical protein